MPDEKRKRKPRPNGKNSQYNLDLFVGLVGRKVLVRLSCPDMEVVSGQLKSVSRYEVSLITEMGLIVIPKHSVLFCRDED